MRHKEILFAILKRLSILFFFLLFTGIIYKYFSRQYYNDIDYSITEKLEILDDNDNTKDHKNESQLLNNYVEDNGIKDIKKVLEDINKIKYNITLLKQDFNVYKKEKNFDIKGLNEKIQLLQRDIGLLQNNYVNLNSNLDMLLKSNNLQPSNVPQYNCFFGGVCFFFYLALLMPETCITYLNPYMQKIPFVSDIFYRAIVVSHLQNNSTIHNKLRNNNSINTNLKGHYEHLTWLDLNFFLIQDCKVLSFSPFIVINSSDKYDNKKIICNYSKLEVGCLPLRWLWRPLWHLNFIKFNIDIIDSVFRYLMNIFFISFGLGILLIKHNRYYHDGNLNSKIQRFYRSKTSSLDTSKKNILTETQNTNIISNEDISIQNSFINKTDICKGTSSIGTIRNKVSNEKPDFVCDLLVHIGVNIKLLYVVVISIHLNLKLKELFSDLLQNLDNKHESFSLSSVVQCKNIFDVFVSKYCMKNIVCISINLSKIFF